MHKNKHNISYLQSYYTILVNSDRDSMSDNDNRMNSDTVCITPVMRGSSGKRETTVRITRVTDTTGQRQKLSPQLGVCSHMINFKFRELSHNS